MVLEDVASVRIGISPIGGGVEAAFLQGRGISANAVNGDALSLGALPSDAASGGRLVTGDVVVALRGATNPAAVIDDDVIAARPCFATLDVGIVRIERSDLLPNYIAAVLNLRKTQAEFARARAGDVTPRLPLQALAAADIPIAPLDHQRAVAELLDVALHERLLLSRLAALRETQINALLADALSGPAEEPVPGGHPARVKSTPDDRAMVP